MSNDHLVLFLSITLIVVILATLPYIVSLKAQNEFFRDYIRKIEEDISDDL